MAEVGTSTRHAIKLDAAKRLALWHLFSGRRPFYLVSEYPKCGGTWVSQMLASYLQVPFPRNERVSLLRQPPSLLHGHHLFNRRFRNVVYVLRDGRDALVSAYYQFLHGNESWAVDLLRAKLRFSDYDDVRRNLPAFIEYMFTTYARGHFHFSWSEYVDSVLDHPVNLVRYEDLLEDPVTAMAEVIRRLCDGDPDMDVLSRICDQYSFERQANRKPGDEDTGSFLRKGIAGDWRNKFNREACEVFDQFTGNALIKAGYESDRSWVERISD